ncbi:uncharacterized protein LOC124126085 [Haliotis rufescens]|uniref:uncharacterized protein LOC124126085 n=1 Tax=Haliotis rufescens TaxID=6454 RepID=UPI00201EA169|nr:uncharacterized protein LOC124126085 [Haliotis rufescens]
MSGRHMDARHNYNLRRTMTPKQIADMFNDFADDYEEDTKVLGLCSHLRIGEYMAETYPEHLRAALQVLDVGAGTGYVGETLSELGFKRIDALDPAQKMLDVAKTKKVYRRLICAFLNKNRIDEIETDQYDCITTAGAFNEGLIPVSAFQEMIRIVKPVLNTMTVDDATKDDDVVRMMPSSHKPDAGCLARLTDLLLVV